MGAIQLRERVHADLSFASDYVSDYTSLVVTQAGGGAPGLAVREGH